MFSICGFTDFRPYLWIGNTQDMNVLLISVCDLLESPALGGISPSLSEIRTIQSFLAAGFIDGLLTWCLGRLWLPLSQELLDDSLGLHFHTTLRLKSCKSWTFLMSFQEIQDALIVHIADSLSTSQPC